MNALTQNIDQNQHHWILWVAPTAEQKAQMSNLSDYDKSRSLMLHPKNPESLTTALETALSSKLYQTITLPKAMVSPHEQKRLELLAIRNQTHLAWTQQKRLNRASQLSLL